MLKCELAAVNQELEKAEALLKKRHNPPAKRAKALRIVVHLDDSTSEVPRAFSECSHLVKSDLVHNKEKCEWVPVRPFVG